MQIKLRELIKPLVMIAAAVALTAGCAVAQEVPDRAEFYLHHLNSAAGHLESVIPGSLGPSTVGPMATPDSYDIEFRPGDLLSLRRSSSRTIVDRASAILGTAFQENATTEAALNLSSHTAFSFSSTTTSVSDIRGLALDSRTSQVMGLTQTFGQGEGASGLSLTQTVTTQSPRQGKSTTSTVRAMEFHSGLSKTSDLMLKASQSQSDVPGGLRETNFQGALKLGFSGGEGPFAYTRHLREVGVTDILTEKIDAAIPIAMYGRTAIAEYHSAFTTTNSGVAIGTRTTHLGLPLRLFGQSANFDHLIVGQDKGAGMVETATSRLTTPFKIGGSLFTTEGAFISLRQPGVASDTLLTKLVAPLAGGTATLQHQTVTTETATGVVEQEQLAMILPTFKIGRHLSLTGQRVSTDTHGVMDQDVTNLSLVAQPLRPWQIEAQCQINDQSSSPTTTSTQLHTRIALNQKTALEGRLSEAQVPGASPNILRLVEFVHDRGNSGFGLRAGLASYEAPGVQIDGARRMEISAGKPSGLALTASYSEYNPSGFARYAAEPTIAVALQHGDPSHFAVRLRYEDQAARIEPLEAVEVAMKALGGTVQMSYQSNPLGPDGKTVRRADQYEASIGRKLFGDLNLQVGYRYLQYQDATTLTDEHFRIQLDGGREARGGKLAVAFSSGDFVPGRGTPSVVTPGSILDITYAHTWGGSGRLSLIVKHRTAASPTLGDDSTEGRLEFSSVF